MNGTFIALEGGEGSGKDTMIDRLKEKYKDRDDIVFSREPGGTNVGERIRSVLMSPDSKPMSTRVELLLFLAARTQLVAEVVAPALAQNKTVILNRFGLSTLAYQIYGREHKNLLPFLQRLTEELVGKYKPHYILLDVSPEVGLARVVSRGDGLTRFDAEKLEFHRRVRQGYQEQVVGYSHWIVNAELPLEQVWETVENDVALQLSRS